MGWARTAPATANLYDAICSGRVHHDGDPILASHVAAGATTEREDGSVRLTKRKTTEPIDALMALMMAHSESLAATGAGASSVYEQRDLITL
jgi:phage terminase large subunit-like protein